MKEGEQRRDEARAREQGGWERSWWEAPAASASEREPREREAETGSRRATDERSCAQRAVVFGELQTTLLSHAVRSPRDRGARFSRALSTSCSEEIANCRAADAKIFFYTVVYHTFFRLFAIVHYCFHFFFFQHQPHWRVSCCLAVETGVLVPLDLFSCQDNSLSATLNLDIFSPLPFHLKKKLKKENKKRK